MCELTFTHLMKDSLIVMTVYPTDAIKKNLICASNA